MSDRPLMSFTTSAYNLRSLAERLDTGDDSTTSRLMLHMLLSLAEWERDTIRDRLRGGRGPRRGRGE